MTFENGLQFAETEAKQKWSFAIFAETKLEQTRAKMMNEHENLRTPLCKIIFFLFFNSFGDKTLIFYDFRQNSIHEIG